MKSTALLTIALFLTIAPSPDAKTMSEITGGFLKAERDSLLSGSEINPALEVNFIKLQASFDAHVNPLARNGS